MIKRFIKYIFIFLVVLGSTGLGLAQNKKNSAIISRILPDGVKLGMTIDEVKELRTDLLPASKPRSKEHPNVEFKMHSEVIGMHEPGATNFYYFFTEGILEGILKTRSLDTLDELAEKELLQASAESFFKPLGASETTNIIRGTGVTDTPFGVATLDKWSISDGADLNIFHVATTRELSVGVVLTESRYPVKQIFLSADDPRFEEYLETNRSSMDNDRSLLLTAPVSSDRGNKPVNHAENAETKSKGENIEQPSKQESRQEEESKTLFYILIFLIFFLFLVINFLRKKR